MDGGHKIVESRLRTEADLGITGKDERIHYPHDVVTTRFAHFGPGIVEACIKFRSTQKAHRGLRGHGRDQSGYDRDDQPQDEEVRKTAAPQCV